MEKENQITVKQKSFRDKEGGSIIVQGGSLIDYITIFRKDGTLVFKNDRTEDVTSIENLLYDIYLVVVNMKGGKCQTDIVDVAYR